MAFVFAVASAFAVSNAQAHNNVVVVPLAGDDVPAPLTPTTPVAKVDPSASDYVFSVQISGIPFPLSVVTDNTTGLIWQREDDNETRTWNEAIDYCGDLELANFSDWRLPTILELQSIVDYGQAAAPIIDSVAFPNTDSSRYWSASSLAGSSSSAWDVSFGFGDVGTNVKTVSFFVRCVR